MIWFQTARVSISRPIGSHSGLLNFLALSRKTGPIAACMHKGRECINIATDTFKIQPYLDSCLREPGKSHEDLLLLVQVAAGDREDNPKHSEDKSCEENCETPAGWLRVNLVHLGPAMCHKSLNPILDSPELLSLSEQRGSAQGWSTSCQKRCSPGCDLSSPPCIKLQLYNREIKKNIKRHLRHWTMATKARMMAARLPAPS